mmetsp:Transcript_1664/g.3439  ORF Transcript_1664/g.3439 Transcript_1664/m.3439 type:complete len:501 (+) Transcript_1664:84-1586(+)
MQLCVASAFLCSASAVRNLRSSVVDLGADGGADASEAVAGVWVPVHPEGEQMYWYNPVQGVSVLKLPAGAVATGALQVPNGTMPTIVPLEKRKSCVPHCAWKCTEPVCEQDCEPKCHRPNCQTRCPKLGEDQLSGCHVQCAPPQCRMYCPKDICEGRKTLDCQTPKCATRCEKPQCRFLCNDGLKCKTVCPDPVCDWKCKKPQACPKPECKMVCEKPPDCDDEKPTLPPAGDDIVGSRGKAGFGSGQWETGSWQQCSAVCGTGQQQRTVKCASGYDEDCPASAKPQSSRECTDYSGCQYAVGQWSQCSGRCGEGTQTRPVHCAGAKCTQEKPATEQKCVHDGKECHECNAVVYGGPNFDGWSLVFGPGKWNNADMEVKGAKCDDISSMKVMGLYCHVTAFEFGDFNKAHHGWKAEFGPGEYDLKGLTSRGAQDNDISSLIVEKRGGPAGQNATYSAGQAGQAGNASKNGIAPGWNGTWPMHGSAAVASWTVAALAALLLS